MHETVVARIREIAEHEVDEVEDLQARLHRSLLTLRAWRWMSRITTNPEEVALLLTAEARDLIELGRQNPSRAKQIGKLIVGYHKLIVHVRQGRNEDDQVAAA